MESNFSLTILIPALNEEERLPITLKEIYTFLSERDGLLTTEIIVVDDGSTDATAVKVQICAQSWPQLHLISFPSNQGKGAAIKSGVLAAQGRYIYFCDADLSTPITELPKFYPPEGPLAEIVIGSREIKGAKRINEPFYRHIMGRVFNWLVQRLVLAGISDTQCGFKCLTNSAARTLCLRQELTGMSFDVELLALARALGLSIAEVPVLWRHERNSRVRPIRDTISMFTDVLRIWYRMRKFDPASVSLEASNLEREKQPALPQRAQLNITTKTPF